MHKQRSYLVVLLTFITSIFLLSACSTKPEQAGASEQADTQQGEKVIKNVWGETKIKGIPSKVVALDFSFVDTMAALGVNPVGAAGTGNSKVPEYVQDKVKNVTYVGERKEPNLELIRSLQPDLIIANPDRHEMIKKELSDIAPTIALDDNSYLEVINNMDVIADILGKKEEAAKVKQELDAKINDAKSKMKNKPGVLVAGAFEDEFSVWLKDSFIGTLLSDVGVNYVFEGKKASTESKTEISKLTMERLAEINPDFLFIYGDFEKWQMNPLFKNIKAAKESHAVKVDRNLWSRGRGPIAAGLILDQGLKTLTGETKK